MRLKSDQIIQIYLSNLSTMELAMTYGVSTNTIRSIKRKRSHIDITGQLQLFPGRPKGNRHILDDQTVLDIYEATGTTRWFKEQFGVSKSVVQNIKFGRTYQAVTEGLGVPGEIRVHSLTWDDVCTIRASRLPTQTLVELFGVSAGTINNIKTGRTRSFK